MILSLLRERESLWDILRRETRPIYLYGMGDGAQKALTAAAQFGIPIAGVFASDGYVRGQSFAGFPVKTLGQVEAEAGEPVILLCFAAFQPELMDWIHTLGQRHTLYVPDLPVVGEELFTWEYAATHEGELDQVYRLLADERSRQVLVALLDFKVSGKLCYLDRCTSQRAEDLGPAVLHLTGKERCLDLGAFDGDTLAELQQIAGGWAHAIAVEPDPKNYRRLLDRAQREGYGDLECHNLAVSGQPGKLRFRAKEGRHCALTQAGKGVVPVETVDNLLAGRPVTYMKLDVEGEELAALRGAAKSIRRWGPKLSVAAYHRSEALFQLPLYLHSLRPDYRFYLRKHPYIPAWEIILYGVKTTKNEENPA